MVFPVVKFAILTGEHFGVAHKILAILLCFRHFWPLQSPPSTLWLCRFVISLHLLLLRNLLFLLASIPANSYVFPPGYVGLTEAPFRKRNRIVSTRLALKKKDRKMRDCLKMKCIIKTSRLKPWSKVSLNKKHWNGNQRQIILNPYSFFSSRFSGMCFPEKVSLWGALREIPKRRLLQRISR